jgi:BirA family biotin operon repressor/biotin-[acetyl-CoA-carboxylase] ligase
MVRFGEVGSTNDAARLLASAGVSEGAVVVSDTQTRGRGRLGRPWASPPGGLWCSVLLRPAGGPELGLLGLAIGVAVAEAVEAVAPVRVGLKWPNDAMIGERKVCGILSERAGDALVVGIGINANVTAETMPPAVAASATSLHLAVGRTIDLSVLLEALLGRLGCWYDRWAVGDDAVLQAWTRRDVTRGTHVTVDGPGSVVRGIADGIDADGALRLRLADGDIRRVFAGDLIPTG